MIEGFNAGADDYITAIFHSSPDVQAKGAASKKRQKSPVPDITQENSPMILRQRRF